jgi:thiamine transport system permease protein
MRAASALAVAQIVIVAVVLGLTSRDSAVRSIPSRPMSLALFARRRRSVVRCAAGFTFVVFSLPLVGLALRSLDVGDERSLAAWRAAFGSAGAAANVIPAVWASLSTAFVAMAVSLVVGVPIALARVMSTSRAVRAMATTCEIIPVVVSAIIVGLGFILTFRNGFFDWRGKWWLLPVAHAVVALPLVSRSVASSLRQIPDDLRHAAGTLGASPRRVLTSIDFALLRRPFAAAATLAALVSIGEFGASSLLSRRGNETLTMTIGRLLGRPGDLIQAQAFVVATVLGLLCLALVSFVDLAATESTVR